MRAHFDRLLDRYDRTCQHAAERVIIDYSTSFRLATTLLAPSVRRDIRALYAVVRIADEIVDGTAAAAGVDLAHTEAVLDAYEAAVLAAPAQRFHTDPILHTYARSARRCGFSDEHVRAFFSSMRRDLRPDRLSPAEFETYVYGSAEVIGLMCLAAFYGDRPRPRDWAELEDGARRLGAAFQKINFLRDLHEDADALGRDYYPAQLGDEEKARIVAEIRDDLATARRVIPRLPATARAGVIAATDLFAELADQLAAAPAAELRSRRIRVQPWRKTYLLANALTKTVRNEGHQ